MVKQIQQDTKAAQSIVSRVLLGEEINPVGFQLLLKGMPNSLWVFLWVTHMRARWWWTHPPSMIFCTHSHSPPCFTAWAVPHPIATARILLVLCDLPEGKRKMVVWTSMPEKQGLWEGEHEHEEELSQHMDPKYQNWVPIDLVVDDQLEIQY